MKKLLRKLVLTFQYYRRPSLFWLYKADGEIYLRDKVDKNGRYTSKKAKWLNEGGK